MGPPSRAVTPWAIACVIQYFASNRVHDPSRREQSRARSSHSTRNAARTTRRRMHGGPVSPMRSRNMPCRSSIAAHGRRSASRGPAWRFDVPGATSRVDARRSFPALTPAIVATAADARDTADAARRGLRRHRAAPRRAIHLDVDARRAGRGAAARPRRAADRGSRAGAVARRTRRARGSVARPPVECSPRPSLGRGRRSSAARPPRGHRVRATPAGRADVVARTSVRSARIRREATDRRAPRDAVDPTVDETTPPARRAPGACPSAHGRRSMYRFVSLRRTGWDSNPRYAFTYTSFPGLRLKPLGHLSRDPRPARAPTRETDGAAGLEPPRRSFATAAPARSAERSRRTG